ncbi:hypothetical protein RCL1_003881 [Eukaryota sp. TZLM3-RCL]
MAEVFVIGNLIGTLNVTGCYSSCHFSTHIGSNWELLEGHGEGRTQMAKLECGTSYWYHPIDLHFVAHTIVDWPKLLLRVFTRDFTDTDGFAAYGVLVLPTHPGHYELKVPLWRPHGSFKQRVEATLLGGYPEYDKPEVILEDSSRSSITAISCGEVVVELNVAHKGFERQSVQL